MASEKTTAVDKAIKAATSTKKAEVSGGKVETEAIEETKSVEPLPQGLTQEQQKIAGLVRASETEAPTLEDLATVIEHDQRMAMSVPKGVQRKEFRYKWLSIDDMERDLYSHGGIWVIVNRMNHSHVRSDIFGIEGAITYRGQNILAYCRKEVTDAINKRTADNYNNKTTALRDKVSNHEGIVVEETDMAKAGSITGAQSLAEDSEYDYSDPE